MRVIRPFMQFWNSEARGSIVLLTAALAAFVIANSGLYDWYDSLKNTQVSVLVGQWGLEKPLSSWVKDLLMSFFFLLVGLEIKREMLQGELANPRRALLTIVAAVGGMVLPAAIYALLNVGGPGIGGWGIPMATDIAFSIGALALLGKRVPLGLKVFLTAFAIVDDLGAVLVIAIFYSSGLNMGALLASLGFFFLALLAGQLKVTRLEVYLGLGGIMWYFMLLSGISPTVAAVLLALAIPITRAVELPKLQVALDEAKDPEHLESAMDKLEDTLRYTQSPLHRMERGLQPWSAYFIMPVFAFFYAGVNISGVNIGPVTMGVFLGLVLGKPVGIFAACWLAVRSGLAALPAGVNWLMIVGAGFLGGIGFTMSLFVAALAFYQEPALLDQAKVGVLASSVVSAVVGMLIIAAATSATPAVTPKADREQE
jgi:Na+:H+ antiporter, NhaA family